MDSEAFTVSGYALYHNGKYRIKQEAFAIMVAIINCLHRRV